ncbi:non-homologous end-joining DNA ligase LigD [Paraburkholderia diazotrophica]|uniref:non-homologous end-joining DNA ligase LigD n=1 Tax=Paraburkholderia diazotrophica TaxID=667676 RepID=UPI0038992174
MFQLQYFIARGARSNRLVAFASHFAGHSVALVRKDARGKSFHIVVPLTRRRDWDEVKGALTGSSPAYGARHPAKVLRRAWTKNRVGKIFIDYLCNGKGASTVDPFRYVRALAWPCRCLSRGMRGWLILAKRYRKIPQSNCAQSHDYCGNESNKETIRLLVLHLRARNC